MTTISVIVFSMILSLVASAPAYSFTCTQLAADANAAQSSDKNKIYIAEFVRAYLKLVTQNLSASQALALTPRTGAWQAVKNFFSSGNISVPMGLDLGHIDYSPDGKQLLIAFSGNASPTVYVYDSASEKGFSINEAFTDEAVPQFSSDSQFLFVTGSQQELRKIQISSRQEVKLNQSLVFSRLSQDGSVILSRNGRTWEVRDANTLDLQWSKFFTPSELPEPEHIFLSNDGRTVLINVDNKLIRIYNLPKLGNDFYNADQVKP